VFILLGLVGRKLQPLQANGHVGAVHDDAFERKISDKNCMVASCFYSRRCC